MTKSLFLFFALLAVASAEHFYVTNNETGITCIILDGDFQFNLVFEDKNVTQKYTATINNTVEVDGNCQGVFNNQSVQTLNIKFNPEGQTARYPKEWELNIVFGASSNEAFKIVDYTLHTQKTELIPSFGTFEMDEKNPGDVTATETNAYKCSTAKLGLVGGASIDIKAANVIAFARLNGTTFPTNQIYEVCYLDARTSDVVPIVVGACLAALVIVVLVGYLIGRARAKRQGYASV
uniref:Lysosome-associated membrane glycoprotein 2-like transmembrane domain-containing protein n=1 Tax=Caenorhabditis japonica TaxID=281687 RepID=A0A8R1HM62_CAEJA